MVPWNHHRIARVVDAAGGVVLFLPASDREGRSFGGSETRTEEGVRPMLPVIVRRGALAFACALVQASLSMSLALEECRLLRQPDIQGDRIVFLYAGDLWTVARSGGVAARLTTHEGLERFPKFSPDGRTI